MVPRSLVRCLASTCCLALLAVSCGSRLSDDQLAGGRVVDGRGATGSDAAGDAGEAPDQPPATFGTLPVPCGPGDQPPGPPPAGTEGVSSDTVEIAVISDKAGQVKVPTASIEESMSAFVAWCNDLGGINGRELELTTIDSELFNHLEATREACDAGVFAIVGSGSVSDNQGAQEMVDCGLVEVPAYSATPAKALSDNVVQPLPNPSDRYNVGPALRMVDEHPEAVQRAAILYPSVGTATVQAQRMQQAYEQAGFTFIVERETAPIKESYATEVVEMARAGVEWVTMVSASSEVVKLLRDMRTQGFAPTVVDLGQQYYGPDLLAEPAAEGAIVQLSIVPFEEAAESRALQAYLDAYADVTGDRAPEPTALGVNAFSAGLLFATAASTLGDDLTRANLLDALRAVTAWDGGGLHAPSNPGERGLSPCFASVEVRDGAFERVHPAEVASFDCDPSHDVDLGDDFGGGATSVGS